MITLEQTKEYLHLDYDKEDAYLQNLIDLSLIFIDSMVGEMYKNDEKAVKLADLLQLKLIYDMFQTRGSVISSNMKEDVIVTSILDKLSNYV